MLITEVGFKSGRRWRSDIGGIEILEEGKRFVEYTKDGYGTEFCITEFQPYERYAFTMENGNMSGCWIGLFSVKGDVVSIDFTEDVTAKKMLLKPFVKGYLKKTASAVYFGSEKDSGEKQ